MSSHHQTLLIIFISPPVITIHQPPSKVTDLSKSALLANGDQAARQLYTSQYFLQLHLDCHPGGHWHRLLVLDQEEDLGHEDHPCRGKQVADWRSGWPAGPLTPGAWSRQLAAALKASDPSPLPPRGMTSPRGSRGVKKPEVLLQPWHLHLHPAHLPVARPFDHHGMFFLDLACPRVGACLGRVQSDGV